MYSLCVPPLWGIHCRGRGERGVRPFDRLKVSRVLFRCHSRFLTALRCVRNDRCRVYARDSLVSGYGQDFRGNHHAQRCACTTSGPGRVSNPPLRKVGRGFLHTNEGWAEVEWSVVVMATGSWASVEPLFYGATRSMTIWRSCHSIGKKSLGPCAMA